MKTNLEGKLSAKEIVAKTGMSPRPEFYSGRDVSYSDISDKRLEGIYQGILGEQGQEAANAYVQMVADTPVLTATDFLLNLYILEGHNWKWDKSLCNNQDGMDVGPDNDDGAREAIAMATVMNVMAGRNASDNGGYARDRTDDIRKDFLSRHGIVDRSEKRYRSIFGY